MHGVVSFVVHVNLCVFGEKKMEILINYKRIRIKREAYFCSENKKLISIHIDLILVFLKKNFKIFFSSFLIDLLLEKFRESFWFIYLSKNAKIFQFKKRLRLETYF